MTQLYGIELNVGKKPPSLTPNILLDLNEIFLKMFEGFTKEGRVVLTYNNIESWNGTSTHPQNGGLNSFGMFALSKSWRNLEHLLLIKSTKTSVPTGDYHKDANRLRPKMKTVTTLEPTQLGLEVCEKGRIFPMDVLWENQKYLVGLGKPYSTFNAIWSKIEKMFLIAQIAKTRREKWFYEFREYYRKNLLNKERAEAEMEAVEHARLLIASAPKRRFGALKVKVELEPSQRLERWFGA